MESSRADEQKLARYLRQEDTLDSNFLHRERRRLDMSSRVDGDGKAGLSMAIYYLHLPKLFPVNFVILVRELSLFYGCDGGGGLDSAPNAAVK